MQFWHWLTSLPAKLWGWSVYNDANIRARDWRFRGIFRFVLPVMDLIFIFYGLTGITDGVGAIARTSSPEYAHWWSIGLTVAFSGAFVGLLFPKLWALEMVGKIGGMALFTSLLYIAFGNVHDLRSFSQFCLNLYIFLLPAWRVGDLGFVAWQRGHRVGAHRK